MITSLRECADINQEQVGETVGYKSYGIGWLKKEGINCPEGYVVTSDEFSNMISDFLHNREVEEKKFGWFDIENLYSSIENSIKEGDVTDALDFFDGFQNIIKEELKKNPKTKEAIKNNFSQMKCEYVYARSSTNRGDSPQGSRSGAYESKPFVLKKIDDIYEDVVSEIVSSLFSEKALKIAIVRCNEKFFNYITSIRIALIFQEMKNKTPRIAGYARIFRENIIIEMTQGLGAGIMPYEIDGKVDAYYRHNTVINMNSLCTAHYKNRELLPINVNTQTQIFSIDEEKGYGIKIIPLEKTMQIDVELTKVTLRLIITALDCISTRIKEKNINPKYWSTEFVIWSDKGENELQFVQLRCISK